MKPSARSPVEVWYAIPSANPENCRARLPVWREMGYRVAVLQNWKRGEIPADLVVWSDTYPGWPGSVNLLCREIVPKTATIVVSGGDDMLPDPNFTAQQLAEQFLERFPDTFGVMQPTGDGFMSCEHYCGSPWMGRRWIDQINGGRGPLWDGYCHNWADNELLWVAKGLSALWQRPDLTHRHEHFSRTGEERPDYWHATVAPKDRADVELFLKRKWSDFPGHEPLGGGARFDARLAARHGARLAEFHWHGQFGAEATGRSAADRLFDAIAECEARGHRRIGLYGAGSHTRALARVIPSGRFVCVIDDDPRAGAEPVFGLSPVTLDDARKLKLDAVILSSTCHEQSMWRRCESLRRDGVDVVRLYEDFDDDLAIRRALGALPMAATLGAA